MNPTDQSRFKHRPIPFFFLDKPVFAVVHSWSLVLPLITALIITMDVNGRNRGASNRGQGVSFNLRQEDIHFDEAPLKDQAPASARSTGVRAKMSEHHPSLSLPCRTAWDAPAPQPLLLVRDGRGAFSACLICFPPCFI